jgi:hypothetical protein
VHTDLAGRIEGLAASWAAFVPGLLVTLALLIWGRVHLEGAAVIRGLRWTAVASAAAFAVAWGSYAYLAQFGRGRASPIATGAFFALMLLPVYSALVACVAFELVTNRAQAQGARMRPVLVQILSGFLLGVVALLAVGLVAASAFVAAAPASD